MAAKNTADIIPMCHPLPLTGIDVSFNWKENKTSFTLNIQASVSTTGKTGVEMEALAASVVALTVYDMTKALDKSMIIGETYLLSKLVVNLVTSNPINTRFYALIRHSHPILYFTI